MAEMIDILNKLREYEAQGQSVQDAIKSTEMTQPTEPKEKPVQEHCHNFQDFLKREGKDLGTMTANEYAKYAEAYADHKAEMSKDESVTEVGGMSDVHIGAQDIVGEYTDEDGNLKMPKVQVIADMDKKKRSMDFPKSYEYDVAMGMVRDDFDDGGARKPEIDAEAEVQEKQGTDHDKDGDIDSKDYLKSRDIAIKKAMGKDINKDNMKKEVKEDMHIMTDDPKEMGMMMQILKLAGVKPVDAKMIGAEEPADETELANSPAGYTNDQKVQSIDDLVNVHSGGLNREKVQVKKEYPGDNPLAVRENDLADSLRTQYESFKKQYSAEAKKAAEPTEDKK
tara:strand:+ start:419 stop:1432 length:1014 start_codon:yes stop_codon:yes gene_type:complete